MNRFSIDFCSDFGKRFLLEVFAHSIIINITDNRDIVMRILMIMIMLFDIYSKRNAKWQRSLVQLEAAVVTLAETATHGILGPVLEIKLK